MGVQHVNPKDPNPGLDACRAGRTIYGWVNDQTGVAAATVITNVNFKRVIYTGERYVVGLFYFYVSSVSDWVTVEFGTTPNADGSGTFTPMTPKFRIDTGAAVAASAANMISFYDAPLVFTEADGGCFTARVQGNDAGATFTLGFNGWYEVIE